MVRLELEQIQNREVAWDRALLAFFLLFQIISTLLIYLHDSQSGFVLFAIITTFIKSVVIAAVMIEVLRFADRMFKKHWLYATDDHVNNLELLSQ